MRVCWGVKAIYGLQGGVLSTRTPFWAPHPCGHPPHTHCSSPGQGSQGQGWGQVSIPRSPSGSGSSSRFRVLPSRTWPCTTSMGSLSSCSRVWGSPSIARYCTFRGRASCSSFQKSEEGAWGPGRGVSLVSLVTLAPNSTPGFHLAPGISKEAPLLGSRPQSPHPRGPMHKPRTIQMPTEEPLSAARYHPALFPGPSPLPSPHHGAGPPEQQGHQVAVLAQQAERGVHGVAPLPLEGDEDGSARELQQPAQALPAGAGPLGRTPLGAHPTPRGTHRKLWLHQARPRKASDSTTMRRRQRLRFTRRSAEGSAGTGRRRGRGGAGPRRGGGGARTGRVRGRAGPGLGTGAGPWAGEGGARAQNGAGPGARRGGAGGGARGTRARQEIAVVQAQLVASTPL